MQQHILISQQALLVYRIAENMTVFMSISKHSPENCPAYNAKYRKTLVTLMEKMEELAKKHDVKILGSWVDHPQHTGYTIMECSFDALMEFSMEPEVMSQLPWSTIETKILNSIDEVLAMLKMAE